jgi:hypothetical protein
MTGERELGRLLAGLSPERRHGEVVIVAVRDPAGLPTLATVTEEDAITVVLRREDADRLELLYDWVAAWVTLTVHSSWEAVGMTAAVAQSLAEVDIPCNVLAGFRHDHLLIPVEQVDAAMAALRGLAGAP